MATNSNNFVRILAPLQVANDMSAIKKVDGTDALSAADIQEALGYVPFDAARLSIENAGSATKLQTARTINGMAFNGTANITITAEDTAGRAMFQNAMGAANGIATLGADAKVLPAQLPSFTPASHVGSGGTAHALATTTTAGFMSNTDKTKLDAITGTNTGDQTTITGNAGSATKLQTSRLINGVSFDGTADITINSVDAVPRVAVSSVGAANGVAPLSANGKLPFENISFTKDIAFIGALSGTTLIPADNTTPLVTEGTQLCSITLGPSSSTSQLFINGCISVDCNTATRTMIVACFRGNVCIGAQAMNFVTVGRTQMFPFAFFDVSYGSTLNGTFGTYSIRFGVGTAATWYVNRAATAILNGMMSTNNPVYFEELN